MIYSEIKAKIDADPKMRARMGKANGYANGHEHSAKGQEQTKEQPQRGPGGERPGRKPLRFFRGDGGDAAPRREMVMKGLMGSGELTVWHGPPKSGKSFLVTDAALAIADGAEEWQGRRIKRHGLVLYLVLEGGGGFRNRLRAWGQHHGRAVPERFVWTAEPLAFMTAPTVENAAEDVARIRDLVAQVEAEAGEPVVLIVIDTAARAMTGADENSAKDMGGFLSQCAILQELPSRPHVVVVHHDNASGTKTRGSTALPGGGNGFVRVRPGENGGPRSWEFYMAKDDPETPAEGFELRSVSLGLDEDGDEVTSCVMVGADRPVKAKAEKKLGDNERIARDALAAAICDAGQKPPIARDIPRDAMAVRWPEWEAAALRYLPQETGARKREAFKRASRSLVAAQQVRCADGWYWLPGGGGIA